MTARTLTPSVAVAVVDGRAVRARCDHCSAVWSPVRGHACADDAIATWAMTHECPPARRGVSDAESAYHERIRHLARIVSRRPDSTTQEALRLIRQVHDAVERRVAVAETRGRASLPVPGGGHRDGHVPELPAG